MIAARARGSSLIERLPPVRGRYRENVSLARITWFRVGGPAEVVFRPADAHDLAAFLAAKPDDVPVTAIGVGSNLLVRDGGIAGVVVRLGGAFARIEPDPSTGRVRAGAAALDLNVALASCAAGISGLEFLSGIPGTIGGALRMNAGAYSGDMAAVTIAVEAFDGDGCRHTLLVDELGFGYRCCAVPESWIFSSVEFDGTRDDVDAIADRIHNIRAAREQSQPVRSRTGGSTFLNPDGEAAAAAWQLIERAGCRGLSRGGAMVSQHHCNFLVNAGGATAADLEALGEEVRRRVADVTGVCLEWEIRRIGEHAAEPVAEMAP